MRENHSAISLCSEYAHSIWLTLSWGYRTIYYLLINSIMIYIGQWKKLNQSPKLPQVLHQTAIVSMCRSRVFTLNPVPIRTGLS